MNSIRHYASVSGNGTSNGTYTPANGEKVNITKFIGSSLACSNLVKVEVLWDTEVLFACHGFLEVSYYRGGNPSVLRTLTGDGSKELKVLLTNDTDVSETFGGEVFWE